MIQILNVEVMKGSGSRERLVSEIFELTLSFQLKYPEIYENLLETPLFLTNKNENMTDRDFLNYRESLKTQLMIFETVKANNMMIVL